MTPKMRTTLDHETRTRLEAERRERILALPQWTLMRLGWETRPGHVQGSICYRVGNGLGPTSRNRSTRDILNDEVQRSHMPWEDQSWGIEILAHPASLEPPE